MAKTGGKKKIFRKKEKKNVPNGIVHIAASFNNTMISITDLEGNLIAQSSAGARGFRGSRKGTPCAAQLAAYEAAKKAHGPAFEEAIQSIFGSKPEFQYFEAPIVIDNAAKEVVDDAA